MASNSFFQLLTPKASSVSNVPGYDQGIINADPTLSGKNGLTSQVGGASPIFSGTGQITGFNNPDNLGEIFYGTAQQQLQNQYNSDLTAQNKYQGDVNQFESNIPLYRGQALGNIVGRGMEASFDPNNQSLNSGALGSQVMNQFNANVGNTLGSMASSYNQFMGDQSLQQQARSNALAQYFANQNYLNQYQNQQQPGLGDIASIGLGALSLI